jgi:hypothetical protein
MVAWRGSAGQNKQIKYLNPRGESRDIAAAHRRPEKKRPASLGKRVFFGFLF